MSRWTRKNQREADRIAARRLDELERQHAKEHHMQPEPLPDPETLALADFIEELVALNGVPDALGGANVRPLADRSGVAVYVRSRRHGWVRIGLVGAAALAERAAAIAASRN